MPNLITTLRDETRMLLICRDPSLSMVVIGKDVGVTPQWLNLFARGGIPNPGVVTIETLNAYLKGASKC